MKTSHRSTFLVFAISCSSVGTSAAEQFGLFSYRVINGSQVEITDYPADAVGHVDIPNQIEGIPVTSIGEKAFEDCKVLTGMSIPASVGTIGDRACLRCRGLISASIPDGIASIGEYAFADCWGLTSVSVPSSVTSIRKGTFNSCYGLTSVSIPSSVNSIGEGAFSDCNGLSRAVFLGDAPAIVGSDIFGSLALGFTVYCPIAATGFTSPLWYRYYAVPFSGPLLFEQGQAADLHIRHETIQGFEYELQASDDFAEWRAVGPRYLGDDTPHDHVVTPVLSHKYYRLQMSPSP